MALNFIETKGVNDYDAEISYNNNIDNNNGDDDEAAHAEGMNACHYIIQHQQSVIISSMSSWIIVLSPVLSDKC